MNLKKCLKCNAIVKVLNDCCCDDCNIKCCGEKMFTIRANTADAAAEKHVPEYKIEEGKVVVRVNHVMEQDHYIEWISYESGNKEQVIQFNPGEEAIGTFKYVKGATIYAYCNKHFLWSKEVE